MYKRQADLRATRLRQVPQSVLSRCQTDACVGHCRTDTELATLTMFTGSSHMLPCPVRKSWHRSRERSPDTSSTMSCRVVIVHMARSNATFQCQMICCIQLRPACYTPVSSRYRALGRHQSPSRSSRFSLDFQKENRLITNFRIKITMLITTGLNRCPLEFLPHIIKDGFNRCLLYTSPSPRDA